MRISDYLTITYLLDKLACVMMKDICQLTTGSWLDTGAKINSCFILTLDGCRQLACRWAGQPGHRCTSSHTDTSPLGAQPGSSPKHMKKPISFSGRIGRYCLHKEKSRLFFVAYFCSFILDTISQA